MYFLVKLSCYLERGFSSAESPRALCLSYVPVTSLLRYGRVTLYQLRDSCVTAVLVMSRLCLSYVPIA
jgi:hypothetical protein